MNKIQKLIEHIARKKWVRLIIMFLILWLFFVTNVYAAGQGDLVEPTIINNLSYYIRLLLSIASWLWIILANLAGKLMTNDILYWSFLHIDASLWTLWNIMKNFANFALWFMVLFAIVQNIFSGPFGKDAGERSPIKTIKRTLIASVLIQSSWFLMWAMVDLSTIMTSAIWAFPSQFIVADAQFQWNINTSLKSLQKNKLVFDPSNEKILKVETKDDPNLDDDEIKKLLDTITPSYDSVSGPLLFIWFAVFDFNEFETFDTTWSDTTWVEEWWDLFLSLGLSAATIIFFSLMMFFIFMFNLFRVIMLWIIIPLLPIIVLFKVFKITDKLGGGKWMDLSKFMDIKNIITLVFKPVIMVWVLSLILVILVLIKNIISPHWDKTWKIFLEDQWNMVIETRVDENDSKLYTSSMKSDWIIDFSMSGAKQTFADIIVYLFWLFLIFFLVKMVVSIKTGISFIDDSMDKTFESFHNILTNLPIIPIAGWVGINALKGADIGQAATRMAWIDIDWQQSRINKLLWLGSTFSSLNTSMTRETWISNAVSAGKTLGYKSFSDLTKSKDFNKKYEERNKYTGNRNNGINSKDIDHVFDGVNP